MSTFDYEGYWLDVIEPLWSQLDEEIKNIVRRLNAEGGVRQEAKTCYIDWGTVPLPLREAIEDLDSDVLARSAVIADSYSHHRPGACLPDGTDDTGRPKLKRPGEGIGSGGWRFALCADKVLSERLSLPRTAPKTQAGFYVHQGCLRLYHQGRDHWIWEEVGLATPETLHEARAWLEKHGHTVDTKDVGRLLSFQAEDLESIAEQLIRHLHPPGTPEHHLINRQPWHMSREQEEWRRAARRAEAKGEPPPERPAPESNDAKVERLREMLGEGPVMVDRITTINHRLREGVTPHSGESPNHPFVIGSRHFSKDSVYLDPHAAPCDYCGRDYQDHTHDTVVVLKVVQGTTEDQVRAAMLKLKGQVETWGIDGFVLTRSPGCDIQAA